MLSFKHTLIGTVVISLCVSYANATTTLGTYNFTSNTSASSVVTGVGFGNFVAGAGGTASVSGGVYNAGSTLIDQTTEAAAFTTNDYLGFTITPTAGYRYNLTSITYDIYLRKASASLQNSITGFSSSGSVTNTGSSSGSTYTGYSVSLGSSNLTNATEFRFYDWHTNSNPSFTLDNVFLTGDTQALADLGTSVTTSPAAKCLVGTSGVQYVLTTTNNALSGGTIAAQTLDYTLGFSSQNGLSFASDSGSGIGRGNSQTNIINVNTSTSGTKGGTVNVASTNAYHQSIGALSNVDVYQAAALTVTGGSSINIVNADTSDGGQRAAARLSSLNKTSGDSALNISGLTAGGYGVGSVVLQNANISAAAVVSGNVLNGTYSARYQLGFEHDDQAIAGTYSGDLGIFDRDVIKTITGNSGNQSVTLDAGRDLDGMWAKSDKLEGTTAYLMDGTLSAQRTISSSWRSVVASEDYEFIASDILTLSGTGDEMFVLQMSYDESLLIHPENIWLPQLAWLSNGVWHKADSGNTGGTWNFVGDVAYDSTKYFALGDYGVDTANNVAWAVIDHGGEFSVIPEPATLMLLGLGAVMIGKKAKVKSQK